MVMLGPPLVALRYVMYFQFCWPRLEMRDKAYHNSKQ